MKNFKNKRLAAIAVISSIFALTVSAYSPSYNKTSAETINSANEEVYSISPTESTIHYVTVPVSQILTEPTEPTEPVPTQGETGDIKWVVNDEKQLIISKNNTGETCSTGSWYETYTVYHTVHTLNPNHSFEVPEERERILDTPWSKCDYNSVIIEEGVTEIGDYSFYRAEFDKISLPDCIRTIKKSAFGNVKTSDKFVFPPSLTDIGSSAFSNSEFDFGDAVLPETLTDLGEYAFFGCSKMKSVDLSQTSIKDIKEYAFRDCRNLQTAKLPQQLESIGIKAFSNTNIKKYIILSRNVKIGYNPMGYYSPTGEPQTTATKFIGYTGSTVAEYASQSDDFTFEPLDDGKGDLNFDGLIDRLDVQLLQEYLTNKAKLDDKAIERADLLEDDSVNVFDAVNLKKLILKNKF